MQRRLFIRLLGCAVVALPRETSAQAPRALHKLGYIHPRTIATNHPTLSALRAVWLGLGFIEGETVLLRSAEDDPRRVPALVRELIDLGVGALIAVGPATVNAASKATTTVPIVAIDLESDPIRSGLIRSYKKPGGNVTGLFLDQPSMAAKIIELLQEAAPAIERILITWDPSTGPWQVDAAKAAARAKGVEAVVLEARPRGGYDEVFGRLANSRRTGVVQFGSAGFIIDAADFVAAAQNYRLPTISNLKVYARAGVLLTYGPDQVGYFARAVMIADKILKGEKAGDLPIERPTKFELVVNLKTAKALDLIIPPALMVAADEVIE